MSVPDLQARVFACALASGLAAVGVTTAEVFQEARSGLADQKSRGLHAGMQFTFRNIERSTDPKQTLPSAQTLVVGAWRYRRIAISDSPERDTAGVGRVANYAWNDSYAPLRSALKAVATELVSSGYRAVVLADDNAIVDRAVAVRAGLGWFGKNTNVLLHGKGSWFVLGCVVTNAPLQITDRPLRSLKQPGGGCGTCSACGPACPTGALDTVGVLDARRCLAWLLQDTKPFPQEFRIALADRVYGCDECQDVCPPNIAFDQREPPAISTEAQDGRVDLIEALALNDAQLLQRFGRWYVAQRDASYLRRNFLLALGNVGALDDGLTKQTVLSGLSHAHPQVVGAALWASARMGFKQRAVDVVLSQRKAGADALDGIIVDELAQLDRVVQRSRSTVSSLL